MGESNLLITPWEIIISIAILFGLIFSIIILRQPKGSKRANRFLALFLFTITTLLFSNFIVFSHLYKIYPHLIGCSFLLWYILPPAFYFYVKTGTHPNYRFAWYDIFHLAPVIYTLISLIPFYALSPEIKLNWFENQLSNPIDLSFISGFIIVYSFVYLAASIYLIIDFEKHYKKDFSNTNVEHIDGIKRLILVYVIYKALDLLALIASFFSDQSTIGIMQFISVSLCIFIFVIVYIFLHQPEKLFQSEIIKAKYKTSPLSDSDLSEQSHKLQAMMTGQKLYLDSDINLSILAQTLEISTHTLSQIINQYYKMNFYEFINQYRVDEVKSQLLKEENKNLTIIAIAYDAGFNSKSSFYKIFKRFVGKSPSAFRKENGIDLNPK